MFEKDCVSHAFSKSRSICVNNLWFLRQNCDFEGLGEESEQTDRRTHLSSGRWRGGGERGCLEGLGAGRRRGGDDRIAYELHPGR